jgi:hypothetical protein
MESTHAVRKPFVSDLLPVLHSESSHLVCVRSEEFDFTVEALQELPRAPERGGPQWAVHRRGTSSEGAYGTATAAQRRYCQYFDMLHNKVIKA